MRKSNKPQSPTPGTIKHLQGALKLAVEENVKYEDRLLYQSRRIVYLQDQVNGLLSEIVNHRAIIKYLEEKLERANSVRSN